MDKQQLDNFLCSVNGKKISAENYIWQGKWKTLRVDSWKIQIRSTEDGIDENLKFGVANRKRVKDPNGKIWESRRACADAWGLHTNIISDRIKKGKPGWSWAD